VARKKMRRLNAWVWIVLVFILSSCQQSKPQRARSAIERGQKYLNRQQFSQAIFEFRLAQRLDPQAADVYFHLGNGYLAAGQHSAAYVNFRKALELDTNHGAAKRAVAQLLASSGDAKNLEEAVQLSKSVLELDPEDKDTLNSLAIAKFKLGEREEAEALLSDLLAGGQAPIAAVITASRMRLHQRDSKGALKILVKQEARFPQSIELALAIGRLATAVDDRALAEAQFQRATRIAPQDSRSWLGLGSYYAQTLQPERALAAFETAGKIPDGKVAHVAPIYLWQISRKDEAVSRLAALHQADLKDSQARARYAQVLRFSDKSEQADALWQQGYQMNPKDPVIMAGHAASLASHGQYSEATTILQELISAEKRSVPGHSLLASIYRAQGKYEQARQQWDEVLQADPNNFRARMSLVQLQLAGGRVDAAAELLAKALPAQQKSLPWRMAQNQVLLMKDDLSAAAASLDDTLKTFPNPEVRFQKAQLHMRRKEWAKARQQLELILDKAPFSPFAVQLMAEALNNEQNQPELLLKLAELARRDPNSEPIQLLYVGWLAQLNRLAESRKELESLKARFPESTRIDIELARVEFKQGNLKASRAHLLSAVQRQSDSEPAYMFLGDTELTLGNIAGAIAAYRKVIELNPDSPDGLNNLASCLLTNRSELDEALRLAQRAKELRPDDANTNDTLGWAYYQKGLYAPAIPLLEQSVVNNNPVNRFHLAMALAKAGQRERAQREFQVAFKAAPNLPEANEAKQVLGQAPLN